MRGISDSCSTDDESNDTEDIESLDDLAKLSKLIYEVLDNLGQSRVAPSRRDRSRKVSNKFASSAKKYYKLATTQGVTFHTDHFTPFDSCYCEHKPQILKGHLFAEKWLLESNIVITFGDTVEMKDKGISLRVSMAYIKACNLAKANATNPVESKICHRILYYLYSLFTACVAIRMKSASGSKLKSLTANLALMEDSCDALYELAGLKPQTEKYDKLAGIVSTMVADNTSGSVPSSQPQNGYGDILSNVNKMMNGGGGGGDLVSMLSGMITPLGAMLRDGAKGVDPAAMEMIKGVQPYIKDAMKNVEAMTDNGDGTVDAIKSVTAMASGFLNDISPAVSETKG